MVMMMIVDIHNRCQGGGGAKKMVKIVWKQKLVQLEVRAIDSAVNLIYFLAYFWVYKILKSSLINELIIWIDYTHIYTRRLKGVYRMILVGSHPDTNQSQTCLALSW